MKASWRFCSRLYPEKDLEETVDFIRYLSEFYRDTFTSNLKSTYSELVIFLLTPLAPIVMAECNIPDWMKAVDLIFQKSLKMMTKGRSHGFLLATSAICVGKRDYFLSKWTVLLEIMTSKLRDKTLRVTLLTCLTRLVWTYLYRCSEAITTTHARLDAIVKIIFPSKKLYPSDVPLDSFVLLLHYILGRHWEYGFRLIWTLLNGDSSFTHYDHLTAERISIALRSFSSFLSCIGTGAAENYKPPFPWDMYKLPTGADFPSNYLYTNGYKFLSSNQMLKVSNKYEEAIQKVNRVLGKL
eukprot:Partr_v1_DN29008_c0_g1_i2_m58962 putative furry homolog (Drosophila)